MPKIALLFTALHIVLFIVLSMRVVFHRRSARIGLGTAGDYHLERKVRAHANFTENVPIALIALTLLEICGLSAPWLYGFGGAVLLGRVLHGYGLSRKSGVSFGRFWGSLLTWFSLLGMAGAGLLIAFGVSVPG